MIVARNDLSFTSLFCSQKHAAFGLNYSPSELTQVQTVYRYDITEITAAPVQAIRGMVERLESYTTSQSSYVIMIALCLSRINPLSLVEIILVITEQITGG